MVFSRQKVIRSHWESLTSFTLRRILESIGYEESLRLAELSKFSHPRVGVSPQPMFILCTRTLFALHQVVAVIGSYAVHAFSPVGI
jgi:hypothetical protein